MTIAADIPSFIARWAKSGTAERANYQLFLSELCDLIGVPRPDPALPDDAANTYVFEKAVTFRNGDGTTSPGRIDLYKKDCFVLEAKQGSDRAAAEEFRLGAEPARLKKGTAVRGTKGWDDAMVAARGQAEQRWLTPPLYRRVACLGLRGSAPLDFRCRRLMLSARFVLARWQKEPPSLRILDSQ